MATVTDWIIVKYNTDVDSTKFWRIYGDMNDIADEIVKLVNKDVEYYNDNYGYAHKVDHFSNTDILIDNDECEVALQAEFPEYHIDYTARRLDKIENIL